MSSARLSVPDKNNTIATFCGSRFFPRHKRVVWLSLRLAAASREETILVKIESPTEENHILTGVM